MRLTITVMLLLAACGGNTTLLLSEGESAQTSDVVVFPMGMVGVSYRYPRAGEPKLGEALNGARHFTFSSLPEGLVGDESSGTITGVPKIPGVFSVVIKVTTSEGESGEWLGSGDILDRFKVSAFKLPAAFVGLPIRYTPSLTGGLAPYEVTYEGLPAGISFDPVSGALSGAPTEQGTFEIIRLCREGFGINDRQRTVLQVSPASEAKASVEVAFCTATDDATRAVTATATGLDLGGATSIVDCKAPQAYNLSTFAELLIANESAPHVDFVVTDPHGGGQVTGSLRVNGIERMQAPLVDIGGIYTLILSQQSTGVDFATLRETDNVELRVTVDSTLGRAYGSQFFKLRFSSAPAFITDLDLSTLPAEELAAATLSYQDDSIERVFSLFSDQPRSGAYPFIARTIKNVSLRPLELTLTKDSAANAAMERRTSAGVSERPMLGGLFPDNPATQQFFPLLDEASCIEGNVIVRLAQSFVPPGTQAVTRGVCLAQSVTGYYSRTVIPASGNSTTISKVIPNMDEIGGVHASSLNLSDFSVWKNDLVLRENVVSIVLAPGESVHAVLGYDPSKLAADLNALRGPPRKAFIIGGASYMQYAVANDPVPGYGKLIQLEDGALGVVPYAVATFERSLRVNASANPSLTVKSASGEKINQTSEMRLDRDVTLKNTLDPAFTQFGLRYTLNPPF